MRGRDTIAVIGFIVAVVAIAAGMATWPWDFRAHRDDMPVVGFLNAQSAAASIAYVTAFRDGLGETGYVEGRQVRIEYGWADGDDQKASMMASELAARRVTVIAATGGLRAAHVMPGAMSTVPALFIAGGGRPGRNLTGVRIDLARMAAKRLELLKELMPSGGRIAMLVSRGAAAGDRRYLLSQSERRLAESEGAVLLRIRSPLDFDRELDDALAGAVRAGVRGFIVGAEPFFTSQRAAIVALAAKHRLAALYPLRSYVEAGGLASYGPDLVDMYRQIGMYTGQILKGAQPGEVPVVSPRKWDLVINRKAALSLRLEVAPLLIARANEVVD
jgi:putative tryptophan/tyrosine transport system substrate-binding protein